MAFAAKVDISDKKFNDGSGYKGQRKGRPYCTHCKIHGHTIDRCFKIHGYPPGYKPKTRDNYNSTVGSNSVTIGSNSVNQVSGYAMQTDQSSPSNFFQNLNSNQYQQLMTMLSTHLNSSSKGSNEVQSTTAASFTTDNLVDPFPDLVLPLPATSVVQSTLLPSPSDSLPSVLEASPPFVVAVPDSETFISDRAPSSSAAVDAVDVLPTPSSLTQSDAAIPHLRKSSRVPQPPSYLKDFHCSFVSQQDVSSPVCSTTYPLNGVLSYQALSPTYKNFILNVSSHYEPQFFHQAVKALPSVASTKNKSSLRQAIRAGVRFLSKFSSSSASSDDYSVKDRVLVGEEMYPLASGPSRKGSGH
ncbi:hypothetical protein LWI29_010140 [Acer saccharum]|uniref:Uncharacterized protein n=1 Tax=Acer saccharum TaxID=4024 RepID=A0AA39T1M1_ACESA|nr:hypothetical protein LWI29_010140 [Acer saccharum]